MRYLLLILCACLTAAGARADEVYDAKADFSGNKNPNGAWTYGWSSELTGPITPYPDKYLNTGGTAWIDKSIDVDSDPNVGFKLPSAPQTDTPPDCIAFHPGSANQFSHCQFTAPAAGLYSIKTSFTAVSSGRPHVYVLDNGVTLADSILSSQKTWGQNFDSVKLAKGDTVDVVIGVGPSNSYANDETLFSFSISRPAPPTGPVYDAKADFSGSKNPNGAWTYGWSADLTGPITPYHDKFLDSGGTTWIDKSIAVSTDPNVGSKSPSAQQTDTPSDCIAFHPGPGNQFSHCRFTAPSAGVYNIQASFTAISYGDPHVYLMHNGVTMDDNYLGQNVPWDRSFKKVSLAEGDTIDAVIGAGRNNSYANDETLFSLTITKSALPTNSVYDAKADFSSVNNPNDVWTYGWSADLAGSLTIFPNTFVKDGGTNWTDNTIEASGAPNLAYKPLNAPEGGTPADSMGIHPGPNNQFSHCRFTAPEAGVYDIQASFTGFSFGNPHAYLLHNGVTMGDSYLSQNVEWDKSFKQVALAQGDTIDAVIGVGKNNSYFNDEALFSLTITNDSKAPQPKPVATSSDQPWSIVGKWNCEESQWKDSVTISPDGTFVRDQEREAGHWTLTSQNDHIILILAWDNWPAEVVTLIGPDQLKSKSLTMKRAHPPAGAKPVLRN
jgi:hypothetical protein